MKAKHRNYLFITLIILFYFIIAHTTILSLDDFRWGTTRGLARMEANFDNYNGRYLGNYTIIAMTRSYLAQILIPIIINSGIVLLIYKIFDKIIDLPIIMFFLLMMPFEIYRQTYGFMSGFANYNTAIFLILVIIYLIKKESTSITNLVLLFVSGFSVQLFLENVSAVNIVLISVFLIYSFFKRENLAEGITLFISNLLGTILMFSNSAYISDDTGRGLSNIDFKVIPETFLTQWSDLFFKNNIALIILLSLGIYLVSQRKTYFKYIVFTITAYFAVRYHLNVSWNNLPTKLLYLEGILLITLIILSFYVVYKSEILDNKMKFGFYSFFLLGGMYSGPLLAISMNGKPFIFPRNVLASYILISISILYLYIPFIQSENFIKIKKYITTVAVALMLVIGSMSLVNGVFNNIRIKSMKDSVADGAEEIYLEKLPFEKIYLTWNITDSNGFIPQYKEYYDIPDYIKIEQVPLRNKYTNN